MTLPSDKSINNSHLPLPWKTSITEIQSGLSKFQCSQMWREQSQNLQEKQPVNIRSQHPHQQDYCIYHSVSPPQSPAEWTLHCSLSSGDPFSHVFSPFAPPQAPYMGESKTHVIWCEPMMCGLTGSGPKAKSRSCSGWKHMDGWKNIYCAYANR